MSNEQATTALTHTALTIADEAAYAHIEGEGLDSGDGVYTFPAAAIQANPFLSRDIGYAIARGFATRADTSHGTVNVTLMEPTP